MSRKMDTFFDVADLLTEEEQRFAMHYMNTDEIAKAYRAAYPEEIKEQNLSAQAIQNRAQQVLKRKAVQKFLELMAKSGPEVAESIFRQQMLSGTPSQRLAAAKEVMRQDQKGGARAGIQKWIQILHEVGAEVMVPVSADAKSVVVSFEDVISGRATVQLPLDGRVSLLKQAGMPWNELDPDASISSLQQELLAREERVTLIHGGSGVGKSTLGGAFALLGLMVPYYVTFIVAPTYDLGAMEFQYVYEGWRNLFGDDGAERCVYVNRVREHDMEIVTNWASRVVVYSLDHKEGQSVLGKEANQIILGEGSQIANEVYERKLLRAADRRAKLMVNGEQRKTGHIRIFTTPNEYEGASAAVWEDVEKRTKKRPELLHADTDTPWNETVYVRKAAVLENPSYPKEIVDARRRTMTPEAFAEQYLGEMTRRSGRVIPEYDERIHKVEPPDLETLRSMRFGVGMDTGKHFAALLAGLDKTPKLWFLDEVYTMGFTAPVNATAVKEMIVENLAAAFGIDPEDEEAYSLLKPRIEIWSIDPASQHKDDLNEELDAAVDFEKYDLLPSIDFARERWGAGDYCMTEKCDFFHWEIVKYLWAAQPRATSGTGSVGKAHMEPRKKDDHLVDTHRFVGQPLWEAGPSTEEAPPVTLEEAFEKDLRWQVVGSMVAQGRGARSGMTPFEIMRRYG